MKSSNAQSAMLSNLIAGCPYAFPNPAVADPNGVGMVAIGADLAPSTLLTAYSQGLFPWFNDDDDPIAWWSPEPRCVLVPDDYQPSKSLRKQAKKSDWITTVNADFEQVIFNCRLPRSFKGKSDTSDTGIDETCTNETIADETCDETWITEEMQTAYLTLHDMGFAHSIEVWTADKSELIGGLYGIKIGAIFCGESMFHRTSNASKIAFWRLCQFCQQTGVQLIDCQLPNEHLMSLGAVTMPRAKFLQKLPKLIDVNTDSWHDKEKQALATRLL